MPDLIESWFDDLIESLKDTIVEGVFHSRWELIKTYHEVGRLITEQEDKFDKSPAEVIAQALGKSERTIYAAIQFYKKYPDIDALPNGKNISWHRIVNELLPEHKPKKEKNRELEAKIWQFIDDFYPKERMTTRHMEVLTNESASPKRGSLQMLQRDRRSAQ